MATIDGITFNLSRGGVYTRHRNIHLPSMNSYINTIRDTGYDGLEIRVVGFETTRAAYDDVLTAFMATGVHSLVINEGWEYRVHSVILNQDLLTYIVDNWYPYTLTMRTSTPYAYSTTDDHRAKSITSNNQEWSAADWPPGLLPNNNFEEWSNGVNSAPNGWVVEGTGAGITQDNTVVKVGTYSARLICSTSYLAYLKHYLYGYDGTEITFGAWVWCNTVGRARINIWTGIADSPSAYHTGGNTWEWLTTTATIHSGTHSPQAHVQFRINYGNIVYMRCDGAVLLKSDSIEDSTFMLNIDNGGAVATPVDIQVTSATAPSSEQSTLSQLESY